MQDFTKQFKDVLHIGNPDYIDQEYHRISWDEYFMGIAYLIKQRSHDSQTQHGCVFVRDKRIISTGFNGYPPGANDKEIPNVRKDGAKYPFINHAEESAIYNAAKEGVSLKGCTAFITGLPCGSCSRKLVTVGVTDWVIGDIGHQSSIEDQTLREYWIQSFNVQIRKVNGSDTNH